MDTSPSSEQESDLDESDSETFKRPLPARPDWAVGLKARPALLPRGHRGQRQPEEGMGTTTPHSFILADSDPPAWKRLINPTLLPHEVINLVEAIFMSEDEVKMIFDLREYEAQTFVNAIHEVCFALFPSRSIT